MPTGCIFDAADNEVEWNIHAAGGGKSGIAPVCMELKGSNLNAAKASQARGKFCWSR
jgi:hypothetical protein